PLGREELAPALGREDLPADPAEVDRVPVQVKGRNPFARLDRRLAHGHRPEAVRLEPLLELRCDGPAAVPEIVAAAGGSPSEDQIVAARGELRVHDAILAFEPERRFTPRRI